MFKVQLFVEILSAAKNTNTEPVGVFLKENQPLTSIVRARHWGPSLLTQLLILIQVAFVGFLY